MIICLKHNVVFLVVFLGLALCSSCKRDSITITSRENYLIKGLDNTIELRHNEKQKDNCASFVLEIEDSVIKPTEDSCVYMVNPQTKGTKRVKLYKVIEEDTLLVKLKKMKVRDASAIVYFANKINGKISIEEIKVQRRLVAQLGIDSYNARLEILEFTCKIYDGRKLVYESFNVGASFNTDLKMFLSTVSSGNVIRFENIVVKSPLDESLIPANSIKVEVR